MPIASIGVVTVTRHRPELLRRAMASVYVQDFAGDIEHVIVVDDDPDSAAVARGAPTRPGLRVTVHPVERTPAERAEPPGDRRSVYPRLSRLFNTGVRVAGTTWIAFLDDDNEFQPEHLRSLIECAEKNDADAVHSGRTLHYRDGSPYLEPAWHTVADRAEAERIYRLMCRRGVRVPGTNVLLDRADAAGTSTFRTSSVLREEDPVMLVDQSVWLLRRNLLLRLPIPETFTDEDHRANTAPDDKLLGVLVRNGVPIFSTQQPTVRYYLGGISNNHRPHDRRPPVVGEAEVERFHQLGYLVLPGFLGDDLVARLKPEVDRWVDEGLRAKSIACALDPEANGLPPLLELEMPAHAELVVYPPLMELISRLVGPRFAFHHLHSDRQAATLPGKEWHHDYEQRPQRDRTFTMLHALHYIDGLDRQSSSLVVLPGSHREVAEKDARAHLGTAPLPGEVVVDELPRGSTVLAHSALFHARRARPDGAGKDRYFVDASYCQAGTRWPQVKPYWRYTLTRARELGIDGGRWPELFAEHHFSGYAR